MLNRFQKIRREFGTKVLLRIILLLAGLLAMSIVGYFAFSSVVAGIIAFAGLLAGFLLKKQIAGGAEHYARVIGAGLFVYGIVLFLGERLGIENNIKLAVITATTVIIFDLQFWSLSDATVMNQEQSLKK